MALKCDVQYSRGSTGFKLTKVGVSGVRKPVLIARPGINNPLSNVVNCSIDIFVDLPAAQRGSHLSRNVEVLRAVADESTEKPVSGLENMAVDMVRKLLVKHEYAQNAYVTVTAEYFRPRKTPTGRDTLEMYTLHAGAHGTRDGAIRKTIGVDAVGMTACPCAQETVGELLGVENPGFPMMSHNQRNVCTILLTTGEDQNIEADDLIDLAERSVSTPTFELLKREDEGKVVINAHSNTRFVEDVVRNGLTLIVNNYHDLPDDVEVKVVSDSQESIHKHNAYAERTATMGELREELAQNVPAL
ncbi:GTP cyclohydrolase I type 2 [Candidatus Methanomethylophilus alvi Mx1201]|uniref:GTP cyclohydrolase MptA n=2 Tax=Methanomethylophilus alvi TaxID=1291540 RepID=M9SL31_METAX|nr:GTP cyclohydrolase MptA [Methanomethylophilus alvi]AGI86157.1 GTP cyclohydrolase I type 2 [Candidatus Methanomethylophilus alvi Mx1201]AYQ55529.1 GTP cyclohydrolase [Methanomethylophilus alvi]MCI5974369.1 GTP cyclohydrolase MptA [Methanomethylophilus alvi]MDD7480164.1 GTP cyclohydrolase MptA [Methanomethylophilus alvi]MDY7060697.1 GTP cyclohydrolase MptA [Methanomethylophilus alvi]